MRMVKLSFIGGMIGVMLSVSAGAEGFDGSALHQPSSVQQTAFERDDYAYFTQAEASESPSDAPPPVVEEAPIMEGTLVSGGGCSCDRCRPKRGRRCCLGDPWTLPQPCALKSRGINVGGWISAGIYGNAHGNANNGPLGFNDIGNGFNMHQGWLFAEKVADTGGCGTDWGFRADYVFGVDGPDTQAFGDGGWDFGWDSSPTYGSAIPQLYAEFAINDLHIKAGRFYTNIGWEVVPAVGNFFYSHSYTMYYAEPFTHMGFLASYDLTDKLSLSGGWTAGWNSGWENLNDANTFLGGIGYSISDRATLTWAVTFGDWGRDAAGASLGDIYMNSLVFEYLLTDKLTYILQHDLGVNDNLGAGDNEWYGLNQYLQYQINDCWAAGMRFEWFRDDDGARVVANNAGNYYGLTAGLNWRPHANVMIRPEIRGDWYRGTGAGPFNSGNDNEQFSGGVDAIFTF